MSLLLSLRHGSNTITIVHPNPQGTMQYPMVAPDEHALHTKIMEKSLALFFYCYQSVVHLQSSLSLLLLSFHFLLFSALFTSIWLPSPQSSPPPCWSNPLFFHRVVWFLLCEIQQKGVKFIHQNSYLSLLIFFLSAKNKPRRHFLEDITEHA
ncbi:hypothetical protein ILYODFUR_020176 [Ilyodon furcidens]|uniref:Uncharacterized protein n=1 Tax=Ilyodon furcidens TaxID=33524 RepID=A0ABV0TW48_9TELE